jgi:glycosyltransferase involved in cell wall biosynthesis
MRWFYGRCRRVISRSPAFLEPLRRIGIESERTEVLTSGIDLNDFGPGFRDDQVWGRVGLPARDARGVKVLYAGRVSVEKNLPLLARAWREASARGVDASLVVVGDGPYLKEMRAELAGTRAHFLGFRHGTELASLYASADLFAFPSRTDTLGQSVMEAQASGLPALVSDEGGPRTIVRDGETGLVLPGCDAAAWGRALAELAGDASRRDRMGTAAAAMMGGRGIGASFEHFWRLCHEVRRDHLRALGVPAPAPADLVHA